MTTMRYHQTATDGSAVVRSASIPDVVDPWFR